MAATPILAPDMPVNKVSKYKFNHVCIIFWGFLHMTLDYGEKDMNK